MRDSSCIGRVNFARIMPATRQRPDFFITPSGDELCRFRIAAEEVLADVRAILGFEILILTVVAFFHNLPQAPRDVALQQFIPV